MRLPLKISNRDFSLKIRNTGKRASCPKKTPTMRKTRRTKSPPQPNKKLRKKKPTLKKPRQLPPKKKTPIPPRPRQPRKRRSKRTRGKRKPRTLRKTAIARSLAKTASCGKNSPGWKAGKRDVLALDRKSTRLNS